MLNRARTSSKGKRGQGMTEYIIVIAIVAIGAILIIGLFGSQIKYAFHRIGSAISGKTVGAGGAPDSSTEGSVQDNMNSFDADAAGGTK